MNYKYLSLLLINGFILGICLLFSYQPSRAQTPVPTALPEQGPTDSSSDPTSPSPTLAVTSTAILTREINPLSTPLPVSPAGAGEALAVSLAELGYEDVTLAGPVGEMDFDLHLPSYWQILPGSSFTLHYVPEMDLGGSLEPFELQVVFDNELIYRTVLNSFDEQSLTIPLPEIPSDATNSHKLALLLRSSGDCEIGVFSLFKIFSDSFFTINYQVAPPLLDLARYPSPIYERTFFTQTTYLVLPDQVAQLPLQGTLSLGARLGQLTENNLILTTTTTSALQPENLPDEHLIIVGTPESNPLLSYLNDTLPLPAPFQRRRLELAGVGPALIKPDTLLTYTLNITNNEAVAASDLGVDVRLPSTLQRVGCQPGCQRTNNTLHWDIDTLQPGATSTIALSFAYPLTTTSEPVSLAFELVQNQEIINILTPDIPVALEGQPELMQTSISGPFFFVVDGRIVPETDGIVQLLPSPRQLDKAILLVTGLTDEAVFKAGRALGTQADLLGMQGQVALVQSIVEEEGSASTLPQHLTFADIGYEDRLLTGITSQDASYRFDLPLNWKLTPEAEVRLNFSHSSLLDPAGSSITLLFNNTPIASVALDESNTITGQLRALLSPEQARPGRVNSLVARVELDSQNPCVAAVSSQIWATIKASSSMYLPRTLSQEFEQLDLDLLPVPFVTTANLNDVIFALPEYPSRVEYDATMKTVSYLGAEIGGNNFQPVALLGYPDQLDLSTSHLILIGRPSRNPLLQEINEVLPQPFIPGTDTIRPQIDRVVFRLPDDLDLGYLQLIPSQWSQNHALLALTGTSDLGLSWATQMVADPAKNRHLKGNLGMAPNSLELHTVDTRELPVAGKLAAIVTSIPETVIVGTATPTPLPPTQTPVPPAESSAASPRSSNITGPPEWVPYVVGAGIVLIFAILGIAYRQSRRRTRLGI